MVKCQTNDSLPLVPTVKHMNSVHTVPIILIGILILSYSSKWSCSLKFNNQYVQFMHFACVPHMLHDVLTSCPVCATLCANLMSPIYATLCADLIVPYVLHYVPTSCLPYMLHYVLTSCLPYMLHYVLTSLSHMCYIMC